MEGRDLLLTELDVVRLARILHLRPDTIFAERLEGADVVPGPQISANIVTMNSRVRLQPAQGGALVEVTLVYPDNADACGERVSVLSPLGRVLLGARCGEEIRAVLPNGGERRFTVHAIPYQPEAAGDWLL